MAAFSEGLALADKAGLSQQTLLEVLVCNSTLPESHIACISVDSNLVSSTQKNGTFSRILTDWSNFLTAFLNAGARGNGKSNVQVERAIYD